jgi:hypothetical protein
LYHAANQILLDKFIKTKGDYFILAPVFIEQLKEISKELSFRFPNKDNPVQAMLKLPCVLEKNRFVYDNIGMFPLGSYYYTPPDQYCLNISDKLHLLSMYRNDGVDRLNLKKSCKYFLSHIRHSVNWTNRPRYTVTHSMTSDGRITLEERLGEE